MIDDRAEIIESGNLAKELRDNPLLERILQGMEAKIIKDWKMSAPDDREIREFLYYRMEAVRKVRAEIESCINNSMFERSKNDNQEEGDTDE